LCRSCPLRLVLRTKPRSFGCGYTALWDSKTEKKLGQRMAELRKALHD